jgi:hypothetical protein
MRICKGTQKPTEVILPSCRSVGSKEEHVLRWRERRAGAVREGASVSERRRFQHGRGSAVFAHSGLVLAVGGTADWESAAALSS